VTSASAALGAVLLGFGGFFAFVGLISLWGAMLLLGGSLAVIGLVLVRLAVAATRSAQPAAPIP
jgi:hypothetical protein